MAVELRDPSLGESIKEVILGQWLKKEGDSVRVDETLIELESDKATADFPAALDRALGAGRLAVIELIVDPERLSPEFTLERSAT